MNRIQNNGLEKLDDSLSSDQNNDTMEKWTAGEGSEGTVLTLLDHVQNHTRLTFPSRSSSLAFQFQYVVSHLIDGRLFGLARNTIQPTDSHKYHHEADCVQYPKSYRRMPIVEELAAGGEQYHHDQKWMPDQSTNHSSQTPDELDIGEALPDIAAWMIDLRAPPPEDRQVRDSEVCNQLFGYPGDVEDQEQKVAIRCDRENHDQMIDHQGGGTPSRSLRHPHCEHEA